MADLEKLLSDLPDDPLDAVYLLFVRIEETLGGRPGLAVLTQACGILSAFYENAGLKVPDPLRMNSDYGKGQSVDELVGRSQAHWRLQFESYRLDVMAKREGRTKAKAQEVIQQKMAASVGYALLTAEEKKECQAHLEKIREIIANSNLDDRKKNNLFGHISTLSREINRNGTRTDGFFAFASDVAFLMGDLAKKAEPVLKEVKDMLKVIARARARKEGNLLPASEELMQLPMPAKEGSR